MRVVILRLLWSLEFRIYACRVQAKADSKPYQITKLGDFLWKMAQSSWLFLHQTPWISLCHVIASIWKYPFAKTMRQNHTYCKMNNRYSNTKCIEYHLSVCFSLLHIYHTRSLCNKSLLVTTSINFKTEKSDFIVIVFIYWSLFMKWNEIFTQKHDKRKLHSYLTILITLF